MHKMVYKLEKICYTSSERINKGNIMFNICHRPIFNTATIVDHYSKKDGVEIKYICTSALGYESKAMDIFYRETPHPEFGNKYFGLYWYHDDMVITNADRIEKVEFGMKEVGDCWHYSQHRHDFHAVGTIALDGGRAYFRCTGDINKHPTNFFKVEDGAFVEVKNSYHH